MRNQLQRAAVVELDRGGRQFHDQVQHGPNWHPGDPKTGAEGGIFNFVTKRGKCQGRKSKIHLDPRSRPAGSAITWKYPSVILLG